MRNTRFGFGALLSRQPIHVNGVWEAIEVFENIIHVGESYYL